MKILLFASMFLLFLPFVHANVIVTRESSSTILYGDILEINISIFNNASEDKIINVYEQVQDAVFIKPLQPNYKLSKNEIPYFKWQFNLPAKTIRVISYTIKPLTIGEFRSAPTKVVVDGERYYSEPLKVQVDCIVDGFCSSGENFLNCAEDCSSGRADGVCDSIVDSICDPDCSFDVDCEKKELNFWDKVKLFFENVF